MNREIETRKQFNDNCWKRIKKDGATEYYNKDYYSEDLTRKEEKLLKEIENELIN